MKNKLLYLPIIIVFIAMIVVGSFFDYQINEALYANNDWFVTFLAAFSEYPGYIILAYLSGYIIMSAVKVIPNKTTKIVAFGMGVCAFACSVYFQGNAITNINGYNIPDKKWIVGMPIALLILTPFLIFGLISSKGVKNPNLWKIAFILLFTSGLALGIINLIKPIMSRPRYRFLISDDNAGVEFHNWFERFGEKAKYLKAGVDKDQFKSLPSAHVGTASFLIALPYFPILFEKDSLRKYSKLFYIVAVTYMFVVAFSRMRAGAHFMSDVAIGGLISITFHYIANSLIIKNQKKFNIII